ncbi:MAG: hypothetical protein ACI9XP_001343 [Lentimonas sp.]|jgi:hypothetical protein
MTEVEFEKLKFPIGVFKRPEEISDKSIIDWIRDIEEFPTKVIQLSSNLSPTELNWKYRPMGWTIKQVIHHCCDSHLNSLIRFKLTLTEFMPVIRPYKESLWAELTDSHEDNIELSVNLISALHAKWTFVLKHLTKEQLELEYIHPANGDKFKLKEAIALYAWHCNHHLSHIKIGVLSEGKYND